MKKLLTILSVILLASSISYACGTCGCSADKAHKQETVKEVKAEVKAQTTCPVMEGNEINKELYADVDGKRIYVCCGGCIAKIKEDPKKYIKKLEAEGVTLEDAPKE